MTKEIYVYKQMFGGWVGISEAEAKEKVESGTVYGAVIEMERGEDDHLTITLLKPNLGVIVANDENVQKLMDEYFQYVEEITGMVTSPA